MPVDEHMPGMERLKDEQSVPELSSQTVTIITTEHYNLQMGRAMTVADTNGRSTLFIGAVSGALIALPVLVCTSAGVFTFLLSLGILQRYQWGQWSRLQRELATLVEARRT